MSAQTVLIGDVHGNVEALSALLCKIDESHASRIVLVGDYVNRGPSSAQVLHLLIDRGANQDDRLVCIAGNHDIAFLRCLDHGELIPFLRMGGAATVRSYMSDPESDVLSQLRRTVPSSHVDFLRRLRASYSEDGLIVTHSRDLRRARCHSASFHVFGHTAQPALTPEITESWAAIDTGCGTLPNGRLTGLVWPSRRVVQVDARGRPTGTAATD